MFGKKGSSLYYLFFLLTFTSVYTQEVSKKIDKSIIKIGEQIHYKISVENSNGNVVTFPEGQTFMPLEMVKARDTDTIRNGASYTLIKEYYLTDAIKIAKDMGLKCAAVWVDEQSFMGINDKLALSIAENLMQNEIKENLMKQGVLMRLPQSIYIDSRAKFIGECELQENVSIIGPCVIESSLIKSGCVIEDSVGSRLRYGMKSQQILSSRLI